MHWGKVLLQTDLAYVAEPLNHWRQGSSNSRPMTPGILEWTEGQRVIRHLAKELGYQESETSKMLKAFADRCMNWVAGSVEAR
jgi:hypothetical protein